MSKMDKKRRIGILAVCLMIVFVGSFLQHAHDAGAATSTITEDDLEIGEDKSGFDATGTGDVYYTANQTTEAQQDEDYTDDTSAMALLGLAASSAASTVMTSMNHFSVAYISEIDIETLEITTRRVTFFSAFDPDLDEWEGEILAAGLLAAKDYSPVWEFQTPTIPYKTIPTSMPSSSGISLFSFRSVSFAVTSLLSTDGNMGLLAVVTDEPEYNGSSLDVSLTKTIKEVNGADAHTDRYMENWALGKVDAAIKDTQGYESFTAWNDTTLNASGEMHYWNNTITESAYFDNDNATSSGMIEVVGGGGDYNALDSNDELIRSTGGEVCGSLTIDEDDMEDSLCDEAPDEDAATTALALAGKLSLLGLFDNFKKIVKRVRNVVKIPRKFARDSRSFVTKWTKRAKKVIPKIPASPKKIIHGIKKIKGKATVALKSAARKGTACIIKFGDKVKGLGFKILGPLKNLGKFILLAIASILFVVFWIVIIVVVMRRRKK